MDKQEAQGMIDTTFIEWWNEAQTYFPAGIVVPKMIGLGMFIMWGNEKLEWASDDDFNGRYKNRLHIRRIFSRMLRDMTAEAPAEFEKQSGLKLEE